MSDRPTNFGKSLLGWSGFALTAAAVLATVIAFAVRAESKACAALDASHQTTIEISALKDNQAEMRGDIKVIKEVLFRIERDMNRREAAKMKETRP